MMTLSGVFAFSEAAEEHWVRVCSQAAHGAFVTATKRSPSVRATFLVQALWSG